jgi:hypothetical protein
MPRGRRSWHEFVQPAMIAREVERREAEAARVPDPVPGDDGEALARIASAFRRRFPDEWAQWAKCPLESGLAAMAEKLKG